MGGKIISVLPGSIAEEIGIEPGDTLTAINDIPVTDLIDFNFLEAEEEMELTIEKPNGEIWICPLEKDYDEELGLVFETNVFDGVRRCHNHCIFCFEDQLQPNPRESLHAKDDDYRMSFLEGNFITCTNMTEEDYLRIETLHLSPLYVSVHTVDPELRRKMLRNKHAGDIMFALKRLIAAGCLLHTQIVLCPGINDGEKLQETMNTLRDLYPRDESAGGVISAAVVPVGLTRFQKDQSLRLFTKEEAGAILDFIEDMQDICRKELGTAFIFPADELYIKAERPLPDAATYEDFPQLENGIGMAALFRSEYEACKDMVPTVPPKEKLGIVTGVNGYAALKPCIDDICKRCGGKIDLITVENSFYGSTVTATGLLTGSCLLNAGKLKDYDRLLLPSNMLKFDREIFLDDVTLEQVEAGLNTKITVVECNAASLIRAISPIINNKE